MQPGETPVMEKQQSHSSNEALRDTGFVEDGKKRLQEGYRKLVERRYQAKYAHQVTRVSRMKLFWLRLKMRVEIWVALHGIGSDYPLYLRDLYASTLTNEQQPN
jgi:hypothetical protein